MQIAQFFSGSKWERVRGAGHFFFCSLIRVSSGGWKLKQPFVKSVKDLGVAVLVGPWLTS